MYLRGILLTTLLSFLALTSCIQEQPEDLGGCDLPFTLENYEMVWNDEFNNEVQTGTMGLDTTKWSFDLGDGCDRGEGLCGWGNNELQVYTKEIKNVRVRDSVLIIQAHMNTDTTSARIVTKNKGDWKYGRFDVRAKLPIGQGLWPAIWMLPTDNVYGIWPKSGEIDIMENIGSEPARVFGTIHFGHDFWRYYSQYYELDSGTFSEDFHVFSAIWTEQCIQFYVDGKKIGGPNTRSTTLPTTWPFDQRFHLILNIAIGGNLPGYPDATTRFPQTMEIDYVRVYQLKE